MYVICIWLRTGRRDGGGIYNNNNNHNNNNNNTTDCIWHRSCHGQVHSSYGRTGAALVYNNGRRRDVSVGEPASPCIGLPPNTHTHTHTLKNISHTRPIILKFSRKIILLGAFMIKICRQHLTIYRQYLTICRQYLTIYWQYLTIYRQYLTICRQYLTIYWQYLTIYRQYLTICR